MKKLFIVLFIFFVAQLFAQESETAIGLQVGVAFPMGDESETLNSGLAFSGEFVYTLNQNIDITGSIGFISTSFSDNYINNLKPDLTGFNDYYDIRFDNNIDSDYQNIPIVVGGRYYFQREEFSPYGVAELGANFISSEVEGSVTVILKYVDPYTREIKTIVETKRISPISVSKTEIGLGFGGGFLYHLGSVKIDANAKFNIVNDFNNFTMMIGILFPL